MSFGSRIITSRKKRKISQSDLALQIGIHANVLGRYERDETLPSIEVAVKISKALDVSLDYLTERIDAEQDSLILTRINNIAGLSNNDQQQVFSVIDALVRDFNAKAKK